MTASLPLAAAQEANYDESKVPSFTLPDPLRTSAGEAVTSGADWPARRAEILELFRTHVYGHSPAAPSAMSFVVEDADTYALEGVATRKRVRVRFTADRSGPAMDILIFVPNDSPLPAPVFLGLNFHGNHSIHPDPAIKLSTSWMRPGDHVENHRATEAARGSAASRWPVEEILRRGFALATIYYGDIDPDFDDGFQNGVHPLAYAPGQTAPKPDEWGSISAWAWGLSRALDYIETDDDLDAKRVAVLGHSRLGKTSLWAGAQDRRFAIVISNDSGCGGAALSRRQFGETVGRINKVFPHWFCDNFNKYNGREDAQPVDQHMLIAAIAPRPVYVASAAEDRWADPRGEFLSLLYAHPVYELLGARALPRSTPPEVDQPMQTESVGYHVRSGKHDLTPYDWEQYLDFAAAHYARSD